MEPTSTSSSTSETPLDIDTPQPPRPRAHRGRESNDPAGEIEAAGTGRPDGGGRINDRLFYSTYHGHAIEHLEAVLPRLRLTPASAPGPRRHAIWLLGDSSLDNKYWFDDTAEAVNGYGSCLSSRSTGSIPTMKQDVSFWINSVLAESGYGQEWFALNGAVAAAVAAATQRCGP